MSAQGLPLHATGFDLLMTTASASPDQEFMARLFSHDPYFDLRMLLYYIADIQVNYILRHQHGCVPR